MSNQTKGSTYRNLGSFNNNNNQYNLKSSNIYNRSNTNRSNKFNNHREKNTMLSSNTEQTTVTLSNPVERIVQVPVKKIVPNIQVIEKDVIQQNRIC